MGSNLVIKLLLILDGFAYLRAYDFLIFKNKVFLEYNFNDIQFHLGGEYE